ncbi:uncharacterized protein LOC132746357 [Ruditapes philippinarum]|uniref:uncharacterized protein LOC132746357 n=1 Tax=Ruditapes philippinarum TaxID=129788 RepID=UPI00295B67AA|nr:uncharacterized protein LOC132746357 [Ruditapes philippinarum]
MPQCQAFNCVNKSGCGKSFFPIPDPLKSYDHRKLCKKWIENLHNKKLNLQTFKAHRQKVVCEDHFTDDCFEGPYTCKVAQSLNFKSKRKGLVFGSVPTIVNVNNHSTTKNRPSIDNIRLKRLKAQLKEELNIQKLAPFTSEYASVKKVEKTALDEERLEISALKQRVGSNL